MHSFYNISKKYSYTFYKPVAVYYCNNDYPSDTTNLLISKAPELPIILIIFHSHFFTSYRV